ncbi:MAG TPA: pseudouridine synthase [Candidatus Saccharimonadales bacterium]|nr:pseudouridine synthase [Candidatus Saccharimonadales bacterium]
MRLNAFLARTGIASRRAADELIKSGRIKVNNQQGNLNMDVSESDVVTFDGVIIEVQKLRYVLLYKPPGYVTTLRDPRGRRKVVDLVNIAERVIPVGRLDYDTSGALLLTNDGELANRLMHPRYEIDKVYEVEVKGAITSEMLNKLSDGVELDDGKTAPAKVKKLASDKIELTIHEGRYHQVKRMLSVVGLSVIRLRRTKYGPLGLTGMEQGKWRELTETEIKLLK